LKRTPILWAERQTTSQGRLSNSGLIINVKVLGTAIGLVISNMAPVSDRLRMMQSMLLPPIQEIDPPLNVRCRWLERWSFIKEELKRSRSAYLLSAGGIEIAASNSAARSTNWTLIASSA
jgi:hypothetical protein